MFVEQRAGERPLGAFPAQHVELFRRQQLAPLVVTMGHFVNPGLGTGDVGLRQAKYPKRGGGRSGVKQMSAREHSSFSPDVIPVGGAPLAAWRVSHDRGYCSAIHLAKPGGVNHLMIRNPEITLS